MWTDLKPVEPRGFIKDYRDFILESVPTLPDWAEAVSRTVLSSVCGNMDITTNIGPIKLNQWNLMIGPSGLAHKSTPLNFYAIPTLIEVSKTLSKRVIMPGRFTVEGLIEYLSNPEVKQKKEKRNDEDAMYENELPEVPIQNNNEGIIIRDEFSSLFKDFKKDYASDTLEFLSELYDGTIQIRYTRKTKLEESKRVYAGLLSATTPYIYNVMEKGFFVQGTGNRIMYLLSQPMEKPKIDEKNYFLSSDQQEEKNRTMSEFANKLCTMNISAIRHTSPTDEARRLWFDFKGEVDEMTIKLFTKNPKSLDYTYLQRLPVSALKTASLASISYHMDSIYADPTQKAITTFLIDENDMKYGIYKAQQSFNYFKEICDDWVTDPQSREVKTDEGDMKFILNFIKESADMLLTQSELISRSKMIQSNRYNEIIGSLIKSDCISMLTSDEVTALAENIKTYHNIKTTGRKPIVYKYLHDIEE